MLTSITLCWAAIMLSLSVIRSMTVQPLLMFYPVVCFLFHTPLLMSHKLIFTQTLSTHMQSLRSLSHLRQSWYHAARQSRDPGHSRETIIIDSSQEAVQNKYTTSGPVCYSQSHWSMSATNLEYLETIVEQPESQHQHVMFCVNLSEQPQLGHLFFT
jgi:hypothetical protein